MEGEEKKEEMSTKDMECLDKIIEKLLSVKKYLKYYINYLLNIKKLF